MPARAAVLLLALCCLTATAQDKTPPEGWKEVSGGFRKAAYKVWMPTDGKLDEADSNIVSKGEQIRVYRSVVVRKDGSLFAAGQLTLSPKLTTEPAKVRQDLLRDLFLEEFNAKLTAEKAVKLGEYPGKEYTARTPKGVARLRLYGRGVHMFRVLFVGTKEQLASREVAAFFDSFVRTPASAKDKGKDKDKKSDK